MAKMTMEAKKRLSELPRASCLKCGSSRSYLNPMAVCFECGNKFCFNHIFGGQVNSEMAENNVIRDVCGDCREKFGYRSL